MIGKTREALEGKVFNSKRYGYFKVTNYIGNSGYNIRFLKTGTILKTTKYHILHGEVMDRFYPSLYNIGYLGKEYNSNHFLYKRWIKMIERCYDINNKKDYINYGAKGIEVCKRWLNFSNFVNDAVFIEGYNEELVKSGQLQLDKDIINRDEKIYSLENCKWVTRLENMSEMNKRVKQKLFIATRIIDGYKEEDYNISNFCNKHNLNQNGAISDCLHGARNDYAGWRFSYKNNSIKYIQKNNSNNNSGYKGISWDILRNKWKVMASKNGKQIYLGRFDDIKEAIIIRHKWEVEEQGTYRKPDAKDKYLRDIGYID